MKLNSCVLDKHASEPFSDVHVALQIFNAFHFSEIFTYPNKNITYTKRVWISEVRRTVFFYSSPVVLALNLNFLHSKNQINVQ